MNNFQAMVQSIDRGIQPDKSFDVIKRELTVGGRQAFLYFIDGFIKDEVYEKILEFLFKQTEKDMAAIRTMADFARRKMPYVEVDYSEDAEAVKTAILSGPSVLLIDGVRGALIVDTRTYPMRGIEEPQKDKSLRGARDGFVETLVMNTAMIRRRIRDERLRMEYCQLGSKTKLDIAIAYVEGLADPKVLDILRKKLADLRIDGISMTQQALSEALQKTSFWNPYPKFKFTERPDYASACILDGRIALVMDNSPTVMLIPVSLADFLREPDDYYFLPFSSSFIRTVRLLTALANVWITPVYLLLVNHPSLIPHWLSFIRLSDSGGIPILAQFLLLEFVVDGLKLASLNTPDTLSSSLGIIGGLLLSEFAIEAGWLIGETVLLMAFVTIASFSLPSIEMGYAMKFERIGLLILTQLFGLWGLIAGAVLMLAAKLSVKTLSGRCYLYPIIPFHARAFAELFVRFPLRPNRH